MRFACRGFSMFGVQTRETKKDIHFACKNSSMLNEQTRESQIKREIACNRVFHRHAKLREE